MPSSSKSKIHDRPHVTEADLQGKSPEEQEMMKVMGFCGFDTTKNKKVDGNNAGEVHVILKRKYRLVNKIFSPGHFLDLKTFIFSSLQAVYEPERWLQSPP